MSLLKNQTSANASLDFFGTGGGGGGGSVVNTSSITVSTIQAAGAISDLLSGDPTKLGISWFVGLDGTGNASDVLKGDAGAITYRDTATAVVATGAEIEVLREEITAGSAQIGYITNPAVAAATGFRFVSSLNGGPDATTLLSATSAFPLGCQLVPYDTLTATAPAGAGAVLTAGFSTLVNHAYQISFQVSEAVTGVPNPEDRVSYVVGGQVLDTISHVEISTLQGANPKGRCVNGVFIGPSPSVQLAASNNTGSAQSTIITCENTFLNGVLLKDMGPTNLVIA